jgi:Flp pilus assembly protein TadG
MMRKLDQRGVAALEFCLVAAPLFLLMFTIFDLGLYAIHVQSLQTLANAGARVMMIKCYTPTVIGTTPLSPWSASNTSPSSCTGDPLPSLQAKQDVAPFVSLGGATPTLNITLASANALTVTASSGYAMIWWPNAAPSASTSVPLPP